ncbi:hypothetical protein [Nonomuraea sp. NEAU-A123]|nr:hypothetical protein [Nonomuraea sp. NEAU-A123]
MNHAQTWLDLGPTAFDPTFKPVAETLFDEHAATGAEGLFELGEV